MKTQHYSILLTCKNSLEMYVRNMEDAINLAQMICNAADECENGDYSVKIVSEVDQDVE